LQNKLVPQHQRHYPQKPVRPQRAAAPPGRPAPIPKNVI
jgi:hypothetical protein